MSAAEDGVSADISPFTKNEVHFTPSHAARATLYPKGLL